MTNKMLVSIITPCYNGEKFIHRLFDSVLSQTYSPIELILVDDGSTDNTKYVALSYSEKFEQRGIKFIYTFQNNQGQAAALNNGLKLYTGEYLTWPDSDDFYADNYAIEKMVNVLANSGDDISSIRCNANLLDELSLKYLGVFKDKKKRTDLLKNCIHCIDFWFTPGCYMAKSKVLDERLIDREIYSGGGGQNWQMMIPLFYKYKCEYLDEPLFNYLVRSDSYSHGILNSTLDKQLVRIGEFRKILEDTISRLPDMPTDEKKYWMAQIENKYLKESFTIYVIYGEAKQAEEIYNQAKNKRIFERIDVIKYFIIKSKITASIFYTTRDLIRKVFSLNIK